jgi:hypothetical protein
MVPVIDNLFREHRVKQYEFSIFIAADCNIYIFASFTVGECGSSANGVHSCPLEGKEACTEQMTV